MRVWIAVVLSAALAACADRKSEEVAQEKVGVGAASRQLDFVAPPAVAPAPQSPSVSATQLPDSARPAMLIRTGHARIEVEALDPAITAVQQLAQRLGGFVTGMATQTGDERIREATLTVRIPAQRFDEALSGLQPLGKVESVNISSEDVGEEYVDVGIRLENGRRLERRLLELLQTRTGKLEEVLAVERELARVREEIERFEGRLRYLRNRADISTVTVSLHEPVPLLSDYQGRNVVLRSFGQAWRNFVGLIAGLIASLGILIPVGVILVIVWIIVRRRK